MVKYLILILLLFIIGLPNILRGYSDFFSKELLYMQADAVIVLSGNPRTRVKRAIELAKMGVTKKIYMTQTPNPSFIEQKKTILKILSFENIDLLILPSLKGGATSTFDEARDAAIYAKKNRWEKIIIVTDEFHTRRAHYAFEKVFKLLKIETKIGVAAAKNDIFNTQNWWLSDGGISAYIFEALKFSVYLFKSSNLELIEQE